MPQRLRHRVHGQEGFTLIELLVVILIIGILAAVAIPAFLSQKSKAADANVKTDLNTAQTAEETYATSTATNQYATTSTQLIGVEPALTNAFNTVTAGGDGMVINSATTTGYSITAGDSQGRTFTFAVTNGAISRTCSVPTAAGNGGGCILAGGASSGTGTW